MTLSRFQIASICFTLALATEPAFAGSRASVASTGADSGTCPISTPCRTLNFALSQVDPGGEILIKDSAGYGSGSGVPVNITKSVTINAPPGVIGFISQPSGDAITVNALATDLVILTGLYIDGLATGTNGVTVTTVGSFSIGGSTITGLTGSPINYINNSTGNQKLTITYANFYGNGGPINIKPTAGASFGSSIRGLNLSSTGIVVDNTSNSTANMSVLFDNSILRYNGGIAITANQTGAGFVQVHVNNTQMYNLNTAFSTSGTASIDLGRSAIFNVSNLCFGGAANVKSFVDNHVANFTTGCTFSTLAFK